MKNYLKLLAFFLMASVTLTSCSDDDETPPTAGFSLSSTDITQWDSVDIISSATGSNSVSYTVTGGEYEMEGTTIEFFGAGSYTIVQTATNSGGSDTSTLTVDVVVYNKFSLDGVNTEFTKAPFWVVANPAHGILNDYIRFENPIAGGSTVDLFKITPISGTNPLEGSYTYDASGEIGTYKIVHTHNQEGFSYDWTTNGESGSVLEIELIEEGASTGNVYDIKISKFTLDYGNWDFATFTWVSEGNKELVFHYRGVIDL
ncbi:MAG: hypothetical protein GQ552_05315 [Flavobacteriaceae bacterium]|nr:hypothetical protein [Flavobacteriaceae bacterium]